MNWSKGFTVKEKILLHLLKYAPYSDQNEVPEEVTQQGIATVINAPRPHVSMALKDLRIKNQLTEHTSHIIHGKRKQKVYFLTPSGLQLANNSKQRIMKTKITVQDSKGRQLLNIAQVCTKHQLSLLTLLNSLTPDGVLDLTVPIKKVAVEPTLDRQPLEKISATKVTATPITTPPSRPQESIRQVQATQIPVPTISSAQEQPSSFNPNAQFNRTYPYYYPQNIGDYYSHYYGMPPPKYSEKTYVALFSIGYILMVLGAISSIYSMVIGELLGIIPVVLLLTFGVTVMASAGAELWYNEVWQNRILILLVVTIPIILYILFFSAFESTVAYYDILLWLIIIFSFIGFAGFSTFISLANRVLTLATLGIIILMVSIVSIILTTLTIYQGGFWLLNGVLCIYLSHTLAMKKLEDLYTGVAVGLGLGILISCGYYISVINTRSTLDGAYFIFIIAILWVLIALILIVQAVKNREDSAKINDMVKGLYLAIPIFFGIILVFFGIFLAQFEKQLETVIELFLGFIVIFSGLKRLKGFTIVNLFLVILIMLALVTTLASILFI